jgi:hypothetical protein
MSPIGGLGVHRRIPVIVIKDDCISCNQIDSKTSCPGREYENEDIGVSLELLNHEPSILELCRTIHSEVAVFLPNEEIF